MSSSFHDTPLSDRNQHFIGWNKFALIAKLHMLNHNVKFGSFIVQIFGKIFSQHYLFVNDMFNKIIRPLILNRFDCIRYIRVIFASLILVRSREKILLQLQFSIHIWSPCVYFLRFFSYVELGNTIRFKIHWWYPLPKIFLFTAFVLTQNE